MLSPLPQGRELKFELVSFLDTLKQSPLPQGRELKLAFSAAG